MKKFSASEAVWPAMKRTYDYLYQPLSWRRFLKLAAVAIMTEDIFISIPLGVVCGLELNLPWDRVFTLFKAQYIPYAIPLPIAAVTFICLTLCVVIHLRFVFFDCLIHKTSQIRQVWGKYPTQADRLSRANLIVWVLDLVMLCLIVLAYVVVIFVTLNIRTPNGKLDPGVFLILFFPSLGFTCFVCLVASVLEVMLQDFILPHMALEGLSFGAAFKALRTIFSSDREKFISYLILRTALPFIAWIILALIAGSLGWVLAQIVDLSMARMSGGVTGTGMYLQIAGDVGLIFLCLSLWLSVFISLATPVAVWIRYYAVLFYGRRYPALGDIVYHAA
ncbi:hypothetical protein ACFPT7_18180 [Acidicapsa dinghuensis]|uniref:Glycerophosphoryl diester phosphodiesterase membrane domain-containing protein n=1 Tax=Acidicapsa dinghuensis TaxID=2218256 RepID=A0ABW1EJX3_9BACT|nr:hypothetical protein [Acidicapsa dinghuensis]